ncbi:MAG: hypothetical protein KAS66_05745 [Candidatus Omnitrophica bacterium]|nr:hypothetical protein [Candidatus Omnitrophota bacterium]
MESNEQYHFKFSKSPKKFPRMLNDSANSIAVYTVLCILRRMRKQLCLEAMIEYMDEYLLTIEESNPQLREAVLKALSMVSIKKIYKDAML